MEMWHTPLADVVVMGWWLALMIFEVCSNLNDSVMERSELMQTIGLYSGS